MTYDDKLAAEEARRQALHGTMKSHVEHDVNEDIAARAEHRTLTEAQRMERVAEDLRRKAIKQVVGTDREVARARGLARLSQFIDYAFILLYTLLATRLALALIAANSSAGFVQFIRTVTNPFYSMFRGIVTSPVADDGSTLALPIVIAVLAYMMLHVAIKGFLRLIVHRRTEI